jgi:DNA-binding XRE family transcriptional regulator|tara:strand:+ start:19516 stop:19800 length:285 start_codon:yes stop_codon:yes gene_type:complete
MTNMPPLDFTKVEALRKHMLLTTGNMAELLGVSRMTYYAWVKGKPIRKKNDIKVRDMLRQLLALMTEGWPQPDVIALEQKYRFQRLLEILDKQD